MAPHYDIAVVGYGPTGLAAASLLGRLGHRVVVCERWPGLYGLPRLTHIDDETARTIQAAGDVDEALRDSSMCQYLWVNGKGETLVNIPASPEGPMGYPDHISMYQPDVEGAIDKRLRGYGTVDVRQGWAVTGLDQDNDGVTLRLRGWNADAMCVDGPHDSVRARYVIAADGSRSGIRELLGVERQDFGFNEQWVNVDTEWLRPRPPQFAYGTQYCDPARGHMTINIGATRQRFEFALLPGETREEMTTPETAWRLLREYHDLGPDDVRITRQLVYGFEARIATRWRTGRVFLAGDAAHTMPPISARARAAASATPPTSPGNSTSCSAAWRPTRSSTPTRASAARTSPPSPTRRSASAGSPTPTTPRPPRPGTRPSSPAKCPRRRRSPR